MARVKAGYWLADGQLPLRNINPNVFTHIFFAFADIQANQVVFFPRHTAVAAQFTPFLKGRNAAVKTLISIGGGISEGPVPLTVRFSTMIASRISRKIFIDSSIEVARSNKFDGLDLDYEIPETQADMSNLGTFLREWKAAVDRESRATNQPALLLTAAVRYTNTNYSQYPYPAQDIASCLDWINAMAYDLGSPVQGWGTPDRTGPTAALYNPRGGNGDGGVRAWNEAGVPMSKIVLGIPFYGFAWVLADPNRNDYWEDAKGPDTVVAGNDQGRMNYNAIVNFINGNGGAVTTRYDGNMLGAYSFAGKTWISYDNETAVAAKVEYVKNKGLKGYFSWEIGADYNFALATVAFNAAAP